MKEAIVLSLGGSIINPGRINQVFLRKFKSLIIRQVKQGFRFIIVAGGGDICRKYQQAAGMISRVTDEDLDWLGIAATKFNAELVRVLFGPLAYGRIIDNPTRLISTKKKILVGSGWKPGCSSDKDAVLLARTYGARKLINLSNIRYVYTADPKKVKSAKPIKRISWDGLLKLTGNKWQPGKHVPFDPEAAKLARQIGLQVVVCQGTDLTNLQSIILGKKYRGTCIS